MAVLELGFEVLLIKGYQCTGADELLSGKVFFFLIILHVCRFCVCENVSVEQMTIIDL